MATARNINVYQRQPARWPNVVNNVCFWALLVGAVAVNRHYLGGSWVIEMAAFCMAFMWLTMFGVKVGGVAVSLSVGENIEWVRAGCPDDVKAWKAHGDV